MSAIVCGKRSFFEDLQSPSPTSASPPVSKKIRCSSSTSPVRFPTSLIDQLRTLFPDMDNQVFSFSFLFLVIFFKFTVLMFSLYNNI